MPLLFQRQAPGGSWQQCFLGPEGARPGRAARPVEVRKLPLLGRVLLLGLPGALLLPGEGVIVGGILTPDAGASGGQVCPRAGRCLPVRVCTCRMCGPAPVPGADCLRRSGLSPGAPGAYGSGPEPDNLDLPGGGGGAGARRFTGGQSAGGRPRVARVG
ncbi:hypothetical protein NDU88_007939 [Pleurodeles waltl]|uniref:Uncharacterized protein n=1 Tax=Pleurodeles waltl TaxID=8319 RepID=A0AAV7RQW0_PLEWA|nr:hypothetical protein NDU88_007939 [Pleurodeles waltl]